MTWTPDRFWAWSTAETTSASGPGSSPGLWDGASPCRSSQSTPPRRVPPALRMWLLRTAAAVAHFHLISLANQAMTETRQNLSQQVKGRRGRAIDKAWAHRMLLLRGGDTLSCRAVLRLQELFAPDDPTGTLQAVWKVKEQLRVMLRTGSLEDAAAAKKELEELVKAAARPETNRLYRTVCRWWKEIEVLIITGATTGMVEANNTAIKNIKRTARGYRNAANYKSVILLRSAVRTAA